MNAGRWENPAMKEVVFLVEDAVEMSYGAQTSTNVVSGTSARP